MRSSIFSLFSLKILDKLVFGNFELLKTSELEIFTDIQLSAINKQSLMCKGICIVFFIAGVVFALANIDLVHKLYWETIVSQRIEVYMSRYPTGDPN